MAGLIIPDDSVLWHDGTDPANIVPAGCSTGGIPRNFKTHPVGCYAEAPAFPDSELIPEDQWADRWNEKMKNQSSLLHIRQDNYDLLQSLFQNGKGLCWAFSTTKAAMYIRKLMGEPDLRFSGWYTAGIVKGWADEGGWGAESLAQGAKNGFATLDEVPSYSSQYATADIAAKAAQRRITEWWDGSDSPSLAQKQAISMLLNDIPCVVDLNVMSHSMCCVWFTLNPITFIYDNSWGEQGDHGLYKGQGAYAMPDGLVIPRVLRAGN